jgi:transcriptional regulator with XRE-family HTH domain
MPAVDAANSRAAWKQVGAAAKDRRLALGWTQQEAADRSGLSLATWRLIEIGGRDRYQELTLRGLARGLGWPVDAVERMLGGGAPPGPDELSEPAPDPNAAASPSPARRSFDYLQPDASLPPGLARKYLELSPEEQGMVQGYIEGLLARRTP